MSKVFEALQKTAEGDASSIILASLGDSAAETAPETAAQPAETAPGEPPEPELPSARGTGAENIADAVRTLTLQIPFASPLLPFDGAHSHAAEQYRIIRTKLVQHPRQPRAFLVSSAGPMDGKTVTAVNIAGAMALKTEANVLLLEGDLRRPVLSAQLGLAPLAGLSEVLSGTAVFEDGLFRIQQFPNLYFMPAGEPRANPAELLDSSAWRALMSRLRADFRYIVVDSPPIGRVADYDLLRAACDGVILVARQDHTSRHACLQAVESIPKDKLLGVVMNCVGKWFLWPSHSANNYYYGDGAVK